jgi:hypothetical protein
MADFDKGISWSDIVNNSVYSGAQLDTLLISRVTNAMNDNRYRVKLSKKR